MVVFPEPFGPAMSQSQGTLSGLLGNPAPDLTLYLNIASSIAGSMNTFIFLPRSGTWGHTHVSVANGIDPSRLQPGDRDFGLLGERLGELG